MAAPFVFPKAHAFPPMYTIQPNPVTRAAQFGRWSSLVQQYCQHHRIFRLELPASYESPLFVNADISRRLAPDAVAQVLDFMASDQGGHRGAWIFRQAFWVYWKTPEEWADVLMRWVEQVGQKNVVLTFYELLHGDGSLGQDFHDMDPEVFAAATNVLVKRGKAQVFGTDDAKGIKFF